MLKYEAKTRLCYLLGGHRYTTRRMLLVRAHFDIDTIDNNIGGEFDATAAKNGVTYRYLLKNWSNNNKTALRSIVSTTQLEKQDVCDKTADSFSTSVSTQYGGKIVASQQVTMNIVNGNSDHGNKGRFPFGTR